MRLGAFPPSTVNLEKSDFGQARVQYLGTVIRLGREAPVSAKLEGILLS